MLCCNGVLPRLLYACLVVLSLAVSPMLSAEDKPRLSVAISLDIPPYVMAGASKGLDLVREALPEYQLQFRQLPYGALQNAVAEKQADISVGVRASDDAMYYSDNFVTFVNYAITRAGDRYEINSIEALKGHSILTWQGAWRVLGDAFQALFGPSGMERSKYIEVADQAEQVRLFWKGRADVIVIDRSIFNHFTRAQGYSPDEAKLHGVFPPVTNYRVAFGDASLRDQFNRGLQALCANGRYQALLVRYRVELEQSVCRAVDQP